MTVTSKVLVYLLATYFTVRKFDKKIDEWEA